MTDLFWPGDERAADLMSGAALLSSVVTVETVWLDALVTAGIAPAKARVELGSLLGPDDLDVIAKGSESGGNPAVPAVALLRERLATPHPQAARWVHRGLTSQDVIDTALILCLRDVGAALRAELIDQIGVLAAMAEEHRTTPMVARTLTQHAIPTTFGAKTAQWLWSVLDSADDLTRVLRTLPIQLGGAAGTLAAVCELVAGAGPDDPPARAHELVAHTAYRLQLSASPPWHTARAPITRIGDVLVGCNDVWGRIAHDVLTRSRPEIGELQESSSTGRGGSSTMPQKHNPILAVLIRRAALAVPQLGATLHLAAADSVDERPDGAWHVEWAALRTLGRHTAVAGSQTTELLRGLEINTARMLSTLLAATPGILAERTAMAALSGRPPDDDPTTYFGASDAIIDATVARAKTYIEEQS